MATAPGGAPATRDRSRRWVALGVGVAGAGLAWLLLVTFGAGRDWAGGVVRWLEPGAYPVLLAAACCSHRATHAAGSGADRSGGEATGAALGGGSAGDADR